ncbi:hypothetical protein Pint_29282 [Pistacia integerrima]|uniref:Uncharacterized protein n=1 Tax=Pistacia integerrima TaxID=434235 RepID=A0ACC0X2R3_9ROSI|nr:hypothetical protein Pint_29282 [Pistacia integerrima]
MAKSLRKQNEDVLIAWPLPCPRPNGAVIICFHLNEIEIAGKRSNPERKWRPLLGLFLGSHCFFMLVSYKDESI